MAASKSEADFLEMVPDAEKQPEIPHDKLSLVNTSDADDALQMALDSQGETWTKEEEAHVLRKIDWVMVPLVCPRIEARLYNNLEIN
jgi:hypothetical protein